MGVKCKLHGLTVKYLREVTPYFRKATGLNDLGWGQHTNIGAGDTSPIKENHPQSPWKEKKTIPLKMCYLCRNLTMPDADNRTLEMHSPDGKSSCIIRAEDASSADSWYNAIHTNAALLTIQTIAEVNKLLSTGPNVQQVKHMGWLAEQVHNEQGNPTWKPVFMAVTATDFLLFDTAPWSKEEWATPAQTHPLICTRLVHSGKQISPLGGNAILTFGTRTGSKQGVEAHMFRVESQRDLSQWSRTVVQGAHAAAAHVKEVNVAVVWQRQECKLNMHYDSGFMLYSANTENDSNKPNLLWHQPFEKLRMSADDGHRLLWLDFGDGGEQELDLQSCPKPLVFILHTFLSSKVSRLGLVA
ncbi:beta-2-syntrophin-like [Lingula anatina]|uniref:Beta-2-syntrophin-like n=1 Tax=Lingula anatina TaxID=7574 RepID=A0A1S3K7L6_LINAN|nr:beta-2-syntrophin-like [Lingula anatina]|eukprot:XP_013418439.1 beta-2-syntrophin-like [Lingula anatina]